VNETNYQQPIRRLFRSRADRKIAGVLGGIAEYTNVDATAVRVLFLLVVLLTGGAALLAYPVMWLVMPERPAAPSAAPPPH
jgi:phage shock protein C